jgi:hypothetical protein
VRSGCRHIHIALADDAISVKHFLSSGERWGCQLTYHYVAPDESLSRFMRRLGVEPASRYWLADAAQVPLEPLPTLADPAAAAAVAAGHPLCWQDGPDQRWSGWGLFSGDFLMKCEQTLHDESLEERMLNAGHLLRHQVARPLSAETLADLLESSRRLLMAQADPVAIGRGSQIHPDATINAPVFIGAQVKVGAGAVIGPNVAIESGVFVGRGAHLHNSIVMPDTYVGEELDFHGVIARGSLLANIPLNVVTEIPDRDLLADLAHERPASGNAMLAFIMRLCLAPLHWLSSWKTRCQRNDGEHPVAIPYPRAGQAGLGLARVKLMLPDALSSSTPPNRAAHFCRTFYPGLREVMRGKLQLVGPTPRRVSAVQNLPKEWRRLYVDYRCGLLNEGLLHNASGSSDEDQFACDALACASQGDVRAILRLLSRYLALVLHDLRDNRRAGTTHSAITPPSGTSDKSSSINHRLI